jgi:hypothetical protein
MLTPLLHPWFRLEKQSTAMYDLFGTVMVPSNSVEIIEMLFEAPAGVNLPDDELILNLSATATAVPEPFVPAKIPVVFTQNRPPLRYRSIQVHYPSGAACQFPVIDLEG